MMRPLQRQNYKDSASAGLRAQMLPCREPGGCGEEVSQHQGVAQADSSRTSTPPRIALQISGYLAGVCETEGGTAAGTKLAALAAVVDDCRRAAKCDVYLHTWDRVHLIKRQAAGKKERHISATDVRWRFWPTLAGLAAATVATTPTPASTPSWVPDGGPSNPCVERVAAVLRPLAVMVQNQPSNSSLLVPELGDTHWYRPARPGRAVTSDGRDLETSQFSHAGTRSMIHGVALAAGMRRAQELFLEAPYDLAVRLRPDVYRHGAHRAVWRPRRCMWPLMLGAAQLKGSVFGCGTMRPGKKNSDLCLWARPAELDRMIEAWEAFSTAEMRRNSCYAELRHNASEQRRRCGLRAAPSLVRGDLSGTVQIPEELLITAVVKAKLASRDVPRNILGCHDET